MRISFRYDDAQQPGSNASSPCDLCNIEFYVNSREDLVKAQSIINGALEILPRQSVTEGVKSVFDRLAGSHD